MRGRRKDTTSPSSAPEGPTPGGPVPASVYTEQYFLECAAGGDAFFESGGLALHSVTLDLMDELGIGPGCRVIDVGSGRGEFALNVASRGAVVVGVDYAPAALRLARSALEQNADLADRTVFVRADAKALPAATSTIDVVSMLDVVEHLRPAELEAALVEVRRVLRPQGRLCIHTMPNRNFYQYVYPLLRVVARVIQRRRTGRDPRSSYEHEMHVNEQTPGSLRRILQQVGFDIELRLFGFEKSPLAPGYLNGVISKVALLPGMRRLGAFHIVVMARPRNPPGTGE